MSKFTPGPWLTKTYTNHELQTDFAMVMMGDRVHMIGYSDEDKANARLIAAAPAMYEALKACAEFIHYYDQEHNIGDGKVLEQAIAALRAAGGTTV